MLKVLYGNRAFVAASTWKDVDGDVGYDDLKVLEENWLAGVR